MQEAFEAPLIFWATFPAAALSKITIRVERRPGKPGWNEATLCAYHAAQQKHVLQWERDLANGGAFELLDLLAISQACGEECTNDGLHYNDAVNEAALQVVAHTFAAKQMQVRGTRPTCGRDFNARNGWGSTSLCDGSANLR